MGCSSVIFRQFVITDSSSLQQHNRHCTPSLVHHSRLLPRTCSRYAISSGAKRKLGSFRHSRCQNTNHPNACFWVREIDKTGATHLSAPGNARLDVVELDVVGVVGLDIGGEAVEGALDGLLGGAVHHAGLIISQYICLRVRCFSLTYCGASSGVHEMKVILERVPSPFSSSYSTSKTA